MKNDHNKNNDQNQCFLVVNFIYKNFLKDNTYSNRGNFAAAKYFSDNLTRTIENININLEKNNHDNHDNHDIRIIQDILKSFKVSIVSDTDVKKSKRNTFVNYLMKPEKIVENLATDKLKNLILRNYNYDQTQEYLNNYSEDIIFSKKQNQFNNAVSNGKFFAGLNNLKFFPNFFGMYSTKKTDNKKYNEYNDLSICPPERIGIYYRPEAFQIQSETLIKYVQSLTLNNTEVYILGANPNIQSEYFNYTHTTDANEFFNSIDRLYTTVPCEPGDVLPNHLFEAILNGVEVVVINEAGIIKPTDLYKIPFTKITAGFLELNMLFDFNHQFWDEQDSRIEPYLKQDIEKLRKEAEINYLKGLENEQTNPSNPSDTFNKTDKTDTTKYEYYNNIRNNLVYSPNSKLEGIRETAEYLKASSLRFFIIEFFEYIFKNYYLFTDKQEAYLKETIDTILPNPQLGDYLNFFFTNGDRLIINRIKREILIKYLCEHNFYFIPYKIHFDKK